MTTGGSTSPAREPGGRPRATRGRWTPVARATKTTTFGNLVVLLFLVAQALDGSLTYVGVVTFGPEIEANPLLAWAMGAVGEGPALAGAKLTAAGFGIMLHLAAVHRALALLTALYLSAAVVPWVLVLYFTRHFL